jgi:hypothetical protein
MNKELTIAKEIYRKESCGVKEALEKIFGKDAFQHDWKDIKTLEDACSFNGTDPIEILPYKKPVTDKQEWLNALAMMDEIVRAINPGFTPDYSKSSQYKWYAWFEYKPSNSGFRFGDSRYANVGTRSTGGSRLCSETEEKATYIAKQFIDIWNIILLK